MDRHPNERGTPRLTDEELEYYGDLYVTYQIHGAGVEFESFLTNPEYFLRKYSRGRWRGEDEGRRRRRGLLGFLRLRPASRTPSG
jgi:hypothetical protein